MKARAKSYTLVPKEQLKNYKYVESGVGRHIYKKTLKF